MFKVQVAADPLQSPDHALNTCPEVGVAVSVTLAPSSKLALQAEPQSMPVGVERTEPLPATATTKSKRVGAVAMNCAVAVRSWLIDTVHLVLAPVQEPPQAEKLWPACGMGVSVTEVPDAKLALHVLPQSIPAGSERNTPSPMTATASVKLDGGGALKVLVTVRAALIVTKQVGALPVQSPPQAVNN
jgi:hypothetical protein